MAALYLRLNSIVGGGLVMLCLIFVLPDSSRAAVACPSKDLVGHNLVGGQPGGGIFTCFYAFPGHCLYNADGTLFRDMDRGFCPPSAVSLGQSPTAVPALSPWALTLAVVLMTSFAAFALRHRAGSTHDGNH